MVMISAGIIPGYWNICFSHNRDRFKLVAIESSSDFIVSTNSHRDHLFIPQMLTHPTTLGSRQETWQSWILSIKDINKRIRIPFLACDRVVKLKQGKWAFVSFFVIFLGDSIWDQSVYDVESHRVRWIRQRWNARRVPAWTWQARANNLNNVLKKKKKQW